MASTRHSLLWSIRADHLPGTSWLFGTMHVRDRRAFGWMPLVAEKLMECRALALEFDLTETAGADYAHHIMLPAGQRLYDLLGAKRFDKLRRILLKAFRIDLLHFNHLLPMMAVQAIDTSLLQREMPRALDETLHDMAVEQGIPTLGIESLDKQLAIMGRLPIDLQLKALREVGRRPDRHRKHLLKMTRMYEEGRIDQLYHSTRDSLGGMRRLMLLARNRNMAESIRRLVESQTTLCGVGAAHLWGGQGVIRYLTGFGLELKPESLPESKK